MKGPTGCRYLADERQRTYVQHGWNLTGDAYLMDEDGYFWFQARTDDMIVTAGYNVAGPEVEGALLMHPAVAECAVVGAPIRTWHYYQSICRTQAGNSRRCCSGKNVAGFRQAKYCPV